MKATVWIDEEVCKGCGLCVFYCPKQVLALSERMNAKGYNVAEVRRAEDCTGCRLCESGCPDFALYVQVPLRRG